MILTKSPFSKKHEKVGSGGPFGDPKSPKNQCRSVQEALKLAFGSTLSSKLSCHGSSGQPLGHYEGSSWRSWASSWSSWGAFGRLGEPCSTLGALGRLWESQEGNVGVRNRICGDLESILGLHPESSFGTESQPSFFSRDCFQGHVVYRF